MRATGHQVRTRGGVFGPGGYGGGIFDGSGMGFGGLGQYEQAAAGVRGLGLTQEEEWERWLAEQGSASGPFYTGPTAEAYTGPGAPSTTPTTTTAVATYPWNTYSSATRALQQKANEGLALLNKRTISEDGYLGPETCGALDFLRAQGVNILKPTTCQESSYEPSPYASAEEPTEATPSVVTSAPAPETMESGAELGPAPGMSRAGMTTSLVVGGLVVAAAIGVAMAARKKQT